MKTTLLSILLSVAALIRAAAGNDGLNLLQAEYSKPGVAESFAAGKAWFPFPAYEDRAGWAALFGPDAGKVIRRGEQLLDYQWQHIPASAYLAFERTGDRQAMERPEGANRGAMIALILAELAEGKGRFIDQLANGVWLAAQQPSWVLSAHQGRQRSKRSLPDAREQLIDLASGRYGSIVSIAYHFFHREFDKLDPSISVATENAVRRNILDPYLDPGQRRANWWLGLASRGSMLNNWTPWCNSDVILCFLLMEKDQERLDRAVAQSVQSMDLFLNYIQKDGACEEGPAYWGAAAGKVYDYLQILYDASDGAFSLFGNERIRKMGEFVSRSYIGQRLRRQLRRRRSQAEQPQRTDLELRPCGGQQGDDRFRALLPGRPRERKIPKPRHHGQRRLPGARNGAVQPADPRGRGFAEPPCGRNRSGGGAPQPAARRTPGHVVSRDRNVLHAQSFGMVSRSEGRLQQREPQPQRRRELRRLCPGHPGARGRRRGDLHQADVQPRPLQDLVDAVRLAQPADDQRRRPARRRAVPVEKHVVRPLQGDVLARSGRRLSAGSRDAGSGSGPTVSPRRAHPR